MNVYVYIFMRWVYITKKKVRQGLYCQIWLTDRQTDPKKKPTQLLMSYFQACYFNKLVQGRRIEALLERIQNIPYLLVFNIFFLFLLFNVSLFFQKKSCAKFPKSFIRSSTLGVCLCSCSFSFNNLDYYRPKFFFFFQGTTGFRIGFSLSLSHFRIVHHRTLSWKKFLRRENLRAKQLGDSIPGSPH